MPHHEDTPVIYIAASGFPASSKQSQDATVAQALEIARENRDGASDPTIRKTRECSLSDMGQSPGTTKYIYYDKGRIYCLQFLPEPIYW